MTSYRELVENVDRTAERLATRYNGHLRCHAGCSGCCNHHLSVFEVESARVRQCIRSLPQETIELLRRQARATLSQEAQGHSPACPFLIDECCSIYAARPIICRTQGLPLLIVHEDGTQEVDFCPLNFSLPGATDELEEDCLIPLDSINERLVCANLVHCARRGLDLNLAGTRISMADVILGS